MRAFWVLSVCVLISGCTGPASDVSYDTGSDVSDDNAANDLDADRDRADGASNLVDQEDSAVEGGLTPVPVDAGVASLSAENTTIQFVGTHVGEPNPRTGVFTQFTGQAEVDPASNQLKAVSVEIQTESLETPIDRLTNHLRSNDFFDAREFPTARFVSHRISPIDGEPDRYTLVGELTMLETTREITFPVTIKATEQGLTLTGEVTIDRTEFGMDGMQERVQPEVALTVTIGRKTEVPQGEPGGGRRGGRGGGRGGDFDPAAMFESRDANGDGKLSGDEIPDRMRENLEDIDADGDQAVTLEEFQDRMRQFRGGGRRGGEGRPSRPQ